MASGRRYEVTASGFYEDEFEDFINYLKSDDNRFIADSKTIISIDSIETMQKICSNCFPDDPQVDRRKAYGDCFSIREGFGLLDLRGHIPNLVANRDQTVERVAFQLKESIEALMHKGEKMITKDKAP